MPGRNHHAAAGVRCLGIVLLLCAIAAGCTRTPPEHALREAFDDLHQAIEDRDAGNVAALLAEDFIGPGGLDRDGARRLAALHFMRHGNVGVLPGPLEIELSDTHARVRFGVVLAGGSGGRVLPDRARAWHVDTGWRREDNAWLMTSAEWTPR